MGLIFYIQGNLIYLVFFFARTITGYRAKLRPVVINFFKIINLLITD